MNLVFGYAVIAALSAAAAYMSGYAGGVPFWLYVAGAGLFAFAAIGQFFKVNRQK